MNERLNEFEIFIPPSADIDRAVSFVNTLHSSPHADQYIFNFHNFRWVRPFSLLFLSNQLNNFIKVRREHGSRFYATNYEHNTYAAHMGFFQIFGLNYGKKPGDASGSSTYLPITYLNMAEIDSEARNEISLPQNIIEKQSKRLSSILVRNNCGPLFETVSYSLREILRNVYEHSLSDYLAFVAQYWPTKREVEIAILDNGVGLKPTLSLNPYLKIHSDRDALNLALLPGVSGKMYKGKKRDIHNFWENSGYGLYMTSRLAREKGSFFIASGDTGILLKKDAKRYIETGYDGTIIRMFLSTNDTDSLGKLLDKFSEEGKDIAKAYLDHDYISGSKASRMITDDFKPRS